MFRQQATLLSQGRRPLVETRRAARTTNVTVLPRSILLLRQPQPHVAMMRTKATRTTAVAASTTTVSRSSSGSPATTPRNKPVEEMIDIPPRILLGRRMVDTFQRYQAKVLSLSPASVSATAASAASSSRPKKLTAAAALKNSSASTDSSSSLLPWRQYGQFTSATTKTSTSATTVSYPNLSSSSPFAMDSTTAAAAAAAAAVASRDTMAWMTTSPLQPWPTTTTTMTTMMMPDPYSLNPLTFPNNNHDEQQQPQPFLPKKKQQQQQQQVQNKEATTEERLRTTTTTTAVPQPNLVQEQSVQSPRPIQEPPIQLQQQQRRPTTSVVRNTNSNTNAMPHALELELQEALQAKDLIWGIQVMDEAASIGSQKLQQRQQQQQQQHDHNTFTSTTTTTIDPNAPPTWDMPLRLISLKDLFYMAYQQKNSLGAYHIMNNYIWWDQVIRRQVSWHKQQKQQQQQQQQGQSYNNNNNNLAAATTTTTTTPNWWEDTPRSNSSSTSRLTTMFRKQNHRRKEKDSNNDDDEFLLKSEIEEQRSQMTTTTAPLSSPARQPQEQQQYQHFTQQPQEHQSQSPAASWAGLPQPPPQDWKQHCYLDDYRLFFRHWCDCLAFINFHGRRHLTGYYHRNRDRDRAEAMVKRIWRQLLHHTSRETQEYILPKFLSSLLVQRGLPDLGSTFCYKVYHYMEQHDFAALRHGPFVEHLLRQICYNRRKDLPWHSVFRKMVLELNHAPRHPNVVWQLLEMYHPYNDIASTHSILTTLHQLVVLEQRQYQEQQQKQQQQQQQQQQQHGMEPNRPFQSAYAGIDLTLLEMICAAAAKAGAQETVLLIWELLYLFHNDDDSSKLEPSEAMYEHSIIAFAEERPGEKDDRNYEQVFTLLGEMQHEMGYIPSRALIRGLSTRFRKSYFASKKALESLMDALDQQQQEQQQQQQTQSQSSFLFTNEDNDNDTHTHDDKNQNQKHEKPKSYPVTVAAFNAVLSGFAERGMVQDMEIVKDLMRRHGITPNLDTFSFLLEGLGKHIHLGKEGDTPFNTRIGLIPGRDRHSGISEESVQRMLQKGYDYLQEMETEWNFEADKHVVKEYVDLLVMAGDVETATEMVLTALAQGDAHLVQTKAMTRLVKAHTANGRMDMVEQLMQAGLCTFHLEQQTAEPKPEQPNVNTQSYAPSQSPKGQTQQSNSSNHSNTTMTTTTASSMENGRLSSYNSRPKSSSLPSRHKSFDFAWGRPQQQQQPEQSKPVWGRPQEEPEPESWRQESEPEPQRRGSHPGATFLGGWGQGNHSSSSSSSWNSHRGNNYDEYDGMSNGGEYHSYNNEDYDEPEGWNLDSSSTGFQEEYE